MRRTISEERRPIPLEIYVDPDKVKSEMVDVFEELSSEGYGDNFRYQAGSIFPPIEDTDSILEELQRNFVYVTLEGFGEEGRRSNQFYVDHEVRNKDEFEAVVTDIDDVVEGLGYDLEFWHIGSVLTSTVSGSQVAEGLNGMKVQATAAVDAGLDSQRGDKGFQPINVGWFYKASMSREIQFGYRAFPNREFEHDEGSYKSDEALLIDLLGRITGERDDETNLHHLSEEEIEVLTSLEDEMGERGLL